MPSYKRPGVYITEQLNPADSITGASLAAAAFLAGNPRGPVTPMRLTSWSQYLLNFGGFWGATDYLPFAVYSYFANGGRECYACRAVGAGAALATVTLNDRSLAGSASEVQTITITGTPTGGTFTLTFNGQTTAPIAYNATNTTVDTALEALSTVGAGNVVVTGGPGPGTPYVVTFSGTLAAQDVPAITATGSFTGGATPAIAVVTTTPGTPGGIATLDIVADNAGYWAGGSGAVAGRDGLYIDITDAGTDRFNIIVKLGGTTDQYVVERWTDLTLVPSDVRYAPALINAPAPGGSPFITVTDRSSATVAPANRPYAQANAALLGGVAGSAAGATELGNALPLFDYVDQPLTLNLPGHTGGAVTTAINYAAARGDVFVVIDTPLGNDVTTVTGTFVSGLPVSSYGAVYYPWVQVADPASSAPGAMRTIPPGGAVCGQYAATDTTRGIFKTPAGINTRISGAVGVERKLSNTELDTLNPLGVNAIRQIPGAGVVIMGGRTLKTTGTDKYVAARRSLIYIRSSLLTSTRFALFEPNDSKLWLTIQAIINRFLLNFWQDGGLRGSSAEEAFFVKCDSELNTPQTIANGEVRIQVGVALQYPAEYVVFNIAQREVGSTVTVQV